MTRQREVVGNIVNIEVHNFQSLLRNTYALFGISPWLHVHAKVQSVTSRSILHVLALDNDINNSFSHTVNLHIPPVVRVSVDCMLS